jgi:D-alanyl-D-alanine carboxypeptidase
MGSAKTGWTLAAKHTYAASAIRDNRELHLILLHSPNKWNDARLLFDYGFANLPLIPSAPPIPPAPSLPSNNTLTVKDQSTPTQSNPVPQIPSPAVIAATNTPQTTVAQTETKQPDPSPTTAQKETDKPVAKQTPKLVSYTIVQGDTLAVISDRYNCEVKDILRHNRGLRSKRLHPGQTILIPAQ